MILIVRIFMTVNKLCLNQKQTPKHPPTGNGSWCGWSVWSACSASCAEQSSLQVRQRTCTCPEPRFGGNDCEGKHTAQSVILLSLRTFRFLFFVCVFFGVFFSVLFVCFFINFVPFAQTEQSCLLWKTENQSAENPTETTRRRDRVKEFVFFFFFFR